MHATLIVLLEMLCIHCDTGEFVMHTAEDTESLHIVATTCRLSTGSMTTEYKLGVRSWAECRQTVHFDS